MILVTHFSSTATLKSFSFSTADTSMFLSCHTHTHTLVSIIPWQDKKLYAGTTVRRVLAEENIGYSYSASVVERGYDSLGKQWHAGVTLFLGKMSFQSTSVGGGSDSVLFNNMGTRHVETTLTKSTINMSNGMIFKLSQHSSVSKVLGEVIVPYRGHCGLPLLCPESAHARWAFFLWSRQSSVPRSGWRPPRSAQLTSPEHTKTSRFIQSVILSIISWEPTVRTEH